MSALISPYTGAVGVRCPPMVVNIQDVSSPGSPLLHSFCFNTSASSKTARLGVIFVDGTCKDGTLVHS